MCWLWKMSWAFPDMDPIVAFLFLSINAMSYFTLHLYTHRFWKLKASLYDTGHHIHQTLPLLSICPGLMDAAVSSFADKYAWTAPVDEWDTNPPSSVTVLIQSAQTRCATLWNNCSRHCWMRKLYWPFVIDFRSFVSCRLHISCYLHYVVESFNRTCALNLKHVDILCSFDTLTHWVSFMKHENKNLCLNCS